MPKRTLKGKVKSNKSIKTIVVEVERKKNHPTYHKVINFTKNFMAHDEAEEAREGDTVLIEESRPYSKNKTWILREVLERAL
jgi:small subunit ribosomal protein S17